MSKLARDLVNPNTVQVWHPLSGARTLKICPSCWRVVLELLPDKCYICTWNQEYVDATTAAATENGTQCPLTDEALKELAKQNVTEGIARTQDARESVAPSPRSRTTSGAGAPRSGSSSWTWGEIAGSMALWRKAQQSAPVPQPNVSVGLTASMSVKTWLMNTGPCDLYGCMGLDVCICSHLQ